VAKHRKILLVDDSPTIRSLLKVYLIGAFAEFAEAPDGVAGLAALRDESFDAAVVDVRMAPIDGIEFVELVRATDRTRELPVILLTSDNEQGLRTRGLAAGADAFVNKPIGAKELLEALELAMARHPRSGSHP